MTPDQVRWLESTAYIAKQAGHIYPDMAACEAAEESRFGCSELAERAKNLFGMKQHMHPVWGTLNLPTREWAKTNWVATTAAWVSYPSLAACFQDRMSTLHVLSHAYPHYANALVASDPENYVTELSKTWSTDPNRATKVIGIYREWKTYLARTNESSGASILGGTTGTTTNTTGAIDQ